MVSLRNQRSNNVFNEDTTTDDSDYEYIEKNRDKVNNPITNLNTNSMSIKKAKLNFPFSDSNYGKLSQSGKRQKCFSKNALMARENRIRKKLYLQNLEETVEKFKDENKKLSSILDNQSSVISDLRKEIKYLKNVLANSTDIGKLLKSINQNTGMPVTTSVNNNIKFTTPVSKMQLHHPWTEKNNLQLNEFTNIEFDEINGEFTTLFSDIVNDSKLDGLFSDLTPSPGNEEISSADSPSSLNNHLDLDHTYTNSVTKDIEENVGVCLHIAKHKVSLEFCSSCSENASTAWNED